MVMPVFAQTPDIKGSSDTGFFSRFTRNYRPTTVPRINFEDSQRIDRLIRAGRIYLSLRDAIALALENNLDVEVARRIGATIVPTRVLHNPDASPWVLAVRAGRAHQVPVMLGLRARDQAEIVTGMLAGDELIPVAAGVRAGQRLRAVAP